MGSGAHGAQSKYGWFLQYNGIHFTAENQDKGNIDGEEQWVQLLRRHDLRVTFDDSYLGKRFKLHQYITDALDACYPYEHGPAAMDQPGIPLGKGKNESITEKHQWTDNKGNIVATTVGTLLYTKAIQDCRMVLMFRPAGSKDETQWVPIKEVFWTWRASAEYSKAYNWQITESKVIPSAPQEADTDLFPEWEINAADLSKYTTE